MAPLSEPWRAKAIGCGLMSKWLWVRNSNSELDIQHHDVPSYKALYFETFAHILQYMLTFVVVSLV